MFVRPVEPGFSPLDEALGLSGTGYSPRVLTWLVRLGAELPFARAAFWLEELTGLTVSAATVRRHTEAVGATGVAWEDAQTAQALATVPPPAPLATPARLVVGADGAMVPLVGGEWGEVKLMSIGEPEERGAQARVGRLSYFARLSPADVFTPLAWGELRRRGLDGAEAVAAIQDGAPWLQGFVDLHRPDAVRILDWPHAAEHVGALAEAVFGVGSPRAQRAARRLRDWLWQEGPERMLAVGAAWTRAQPHQPDLARALAYFQERRAQLAYPSFRAAGWPVGSGATESGHKQVMQARMKRAGMRWARPHVNPLLALTLLEHNARWESDGPRLLAHHRAGGVRQRRERQRARHAARACAAPPHCPARQLPTSPAPAPAPSHPWRRYGASLSAKK